MRQDIGKEMLGVRFSRHIMKRVLKILISTILILVGVGVFLYPNFREWNTNREVNQIVKQFEKDFKTDESQSDKKPDSESSDTSESSESSDSTPTKFTELYQELQDYNKNLVANGQQLTDAWSYQQAPISLDHMPSKDATIGYIDIPDMKVKLPLLLGASKDNLSKGAAVLSQTSMPIGGADTNCVIAAHRGWRGSAYFQRIENMKVGSKVYVTNPWETLVYEVTSTKVVNPDDVDVIKLQPGKDMVTLISCHPYVLGGGPYRYIVYCERVGTEEKRENVKMENPAIDDSIDDSVQIPQDELDASDKLLYWEQYLRIGLPVVTILLSILIIVVNRRKK